MAISKKYQRLICTALGLCLIFFPAFTPMPAIAANDLVITGGAGGKGGAQNGNGLAGGNGVVTLDGSSSPAGALVYTGAAGGSSTGGASGSNGTGGGGGGAGGTGGAGNNTGGGGGGGLAGAGSIGDAGGGTGGAGATGNFAGGGGGGGGNANFNHSVDITYGNISVTGGTGGALAADIFHSGGGGGGGGAAFENSMASNIIVIGGIDIYGGNGGAGNNANLGATAGNGGDATFNSGSGNVSAASIGVASGTNGASLTTNYGLSGSASFTVLGMLSAPTIALTKNDGSLTFTAGTLLVDKNTTFTMDKGTAAGNFAVSVNGLSFLDGSNLTVVQVQGTETMTFGGNLFVSDKGNSLNSSIGFDASGNTITFNLPTDITAGDVLLSSSGSSIKLTGSRVAMTVASAGGQPGTLNSLNTGDQITLIEGIDQSTWDGSQSEVTTSGGAIDYTFALGTEQQSGIWSLTSTLQGESFDEAKAHNALMSASALSLLLTQGSDRAAGLPGKFTPSGLRLDAAGNIQYGFYMDMGGGHYEMKTDSHVESDSFHLLAGPGLRFNHADGAKTGLGLFFEAGWGNFDTYNSFYRGDDDTSYYGAGLLARHDFASGLYGEATLRLGQAKSEYDSDYDTDYDISSTYYGGHLGLGYILPVSEPGSLDFSAKLLYTRLEGDTDTNSAGDRMKVGDTDSLRTQLGVQYNHKLADDFTAFGKVAWDYEFDGETTGRYNQYRISETDPSGSTGIGEIGLKWRATDNFSIDLSGHGLVGQREGYGGNLGFRLEF